MKLKPCFAGMLALLLVSSAAAQTNSTPIFQFAIFYNSLLEFTFCGPMTVNGRTHANGNIYTGTAWQLTFNSLVTATGTISSPAWDGHLISEYTVFPRFSAGYSTNWSPLLLPIASTDMHEIVNLPPDGEDPNSPMGQQRYYNEAGIVLLVSNATVTVMLKNSPTDPVPTSITAKYYPANLVATNYGQITTNFPWLNVTNTFTDQREGDLVKATDIDMSKLARWLFTNAAVNAKFPKASGVYNVSNAPNILYVADNRTNGASQLTAVRLKNGTTIPTNLVSIAGVNQPSGFTVATPNPLYVWGVYNCPNSSALNTTNTSAIYPASLISDALTILSPNWVDSQSAMALGGGKAAAASDTANAAIITGNVPSTGSGSTQFSGGVHNLPRLLEDWGSGTSPTLTLNTSIVNLFSSLRATNQFQNPGVYYQAPIRLFSFNQNFLNPTQLPPGTPLLGPATLVQPPNQAVMAGQTAVFSAWVIGYAPLSYQWQVSVDGGATFANVSTTATNASYTNLVTTSADNGNQYRVIVSGTGSLSQTSAPPAVLTVLTPATANAGGNQKICAGYGTAGLGGSVGGCASGGTWTSSGTGTFAPDATTLNASYTPSAADISAGTVTLTLTTTGQTSPCPAARALVGVTINQAATASAGGAQTICSSSATAGLGGSVGGGDTGGMWSSPTDGTFTPNATTLNASYTPSAADISAGTVTLTLTTTGQTSPCGAATAQVVVTVQAAATASAGAIRRFARAVAPRRWADRWAAAPRVAGGRLRARAPSCWA